MPCVSNLVTKKKQKKKKSRKYQMFSLDILTHLTIINLQIVYLMQKIKSKNLVNGFDISRFVKNTDLDRRKKITRKS